MRHKTFIIASLLTLGAVPLLIWVWRQARYIQLDPVSDEWLQNANLIEVDPYVR